MRALTILLLGAAAFAALALTAPTVQAQAVDPHDCRYCHGLHGTGGLVPDTSSATWDQTLCMSCHLDGAPNAIDGKSAPTGVAVHTGPKHDQGPPIDETVCRECHNQHFGEVSPNIKLIHSTMESRYTGTKTVNFLARSGVNSFADGDSTYDGVCEVCHTGTDHHLHNGPLESNQHNAQATCTGCHPHGDGFAKPEGEPQTCVQCHTSAQGARRIINVDFTYTSHHIDWEAAGLTSEQEIPESDCLACHDVSAHTGGTVILKNADDPAITYSLLGDPLTDSAEAAKLTPFCLSCHDADAAAGAAPFSDLLTPPVIDATAWSGASHANTAAIPGGCYGTCHANGHGSQKAKLLAPFDLVATAPGLEEEEEGFCTNCHDADGPAATDIAADFAFTINWVDQAVGEQDLTTLNDRHDVQYAASSVSGAKVECADCHNPHVATAAQPWTSDPDPANTPTLAGQGFTPYSEFCLDCHDGTLPAGVLDHTGGPMTNIDVAFSAASKKDRHGLNAAKSTNLDPATTGWGEGAVLECFTCHRGHPQPAANVANTNNLFSLRTWPHGVVNNDPLQETVPLNNIGTFDLNHSFMENLGGGSGNAPFDGGYWCNTCHTRSSMFGKDNCSQSGCHAHDASNF